MRYLTVFASLLTAALLAACSPEGARAPESETASAADDFPAPSGRYTLDPYHASLVFRADHLGFSFYTGSFSTFDAVLNFTPDDPGAMSVSASIDVGSLQIPAPPEGFFATLMSEKWFNEAAHPQITFQSAAVTRTGPRTARIDGRLTMLGVSAPVSFDAEFRGGYPGFRPYDPNARIGFTASGSLNRSDFGMAEGLPPEGSTMGVMDAVTFRIDAEFTGPPAPEEQRDNSPEATRK